MDRLCNFPLAIFQNCSASPVRHSDYFFGLYSLLVKPAYQNICPADEQVSYDKFSYSICFIC